MGFIDPGCVSRTLIFSFFTRGIITVSIHAIVVQISQKMLAGFNKTDQNNTHQERYSSDATTGTHKTSKRLAPEQLPEIIANVAPHAFAGVLRDGNGQRGNGKTQSNFTVSVNNQPPPRAHHTGDDLGKAPAAGDEAAARGHAQKIAVGVLVAALRVDFERHLGLVAVLLEQSRQGGRVGPGFFQLAAVLVAAAHDCTAWISGGILGKTFSR